MGGILLTTLLILAAIGYAAFALFSNWMSEGWAVLMAIAVIGGILAFVVSRIRRRIRAVMANPSLAGLVKGGGTAAIMALIMRNPRLLFTLGSAYMAMRRNRR